jgi:hypothetical protein
MNAKLAERQPRVLRLRPLRRTSLRMTNQLFNLTGQLFSAFQIKDARSC